MPTNKPKLKTTVDTLSRDIKNEMTNQDVSIRELARRMDKWPSVIHRALKYDKLSFQMASDMCFHLGFKLDIRLEKKQ